MAINKEQTVLIHYTLKNEAGEVLDSSEGKDPLEFVYGAGMIIAGLENALADKNKGDKFNVIIPLKMLMVQSKMSLSKMFL